MKKLVLSFADPDKWRNLSERNKFSSEEWKQLRLKILKRDDYTCQYCGYRSEKFQIIDHIDGNPQNNEESNLQTICQMCNLIKHAGQGCVVKGVVDLYKDSKYNQNDIIR
ncbi:MAG: HNH endonuclease, partial [Candidatus Bathyarchaeia archaeon]